ncbi:MAG: cupredoxin family copper-binding protein [Dehalococcoidales bacterium]
MSSYVYVKSSTVLLIGLLLSAMSVFGLSCQASTPTPAPTPTTTEIEISGFAFAPATVTVPVGSTVTWTNRDSAPHTVTARDTQFDSGSLSRDNTFSYTFDQSGNFEYYCTIHPRMVGTVIVE